MNKNKLHVVFDSPLLVLLDTPKPVQQEVFAKFTININNSQYEHSGVNMSEVLGVGHFATVTVQWVDSTGAPAPVDGPTSWASTDPSVMTCTVSTGNPLIANCQAVAIGTVQIQATADADMGQGVKTITSALDVNVIAGEAVGGSMNMIDLGTGPPPEGGTAKKK